MHSTCGAQASGSLRSGCLRSTKRQPASRRRGSGALRSHSGSSESSSFGTRTARIRARVFFALADTHYSLCSRGRESGPSPRYLCGAWLACVRAIVSHAERKPGRHEYHLPRGRARRFPRADLTARRWPGPLMAGLLSGQCSAADFSTLRPGTVQWFPAALSTA